MPIVLGLLLAFTTATILFFIAISWGRLEAALHNDEFAGSGEE